MRVVVRGRVQGVWFRAWTESEARARGLRGWVRNRRDGAVEALFHGADAAVDAMVALCREGPPAARVETLEAVPAAPPEEAGFRVLPSG